MLACMLSLGSGALTWTRILGTDAIDVAPGPTTPGSVELPASAQSGDALFLFGGQKSDGSPTNKLYGFGLDASGAPGWRDLTPANMNDRGHFGGLRNFSVGFYPRQVQRHVSTARPLTLAQRPRWLLHGLSDELARLSLWRPGPGCQRRGGLSQRLVVV